MTIDAFDADCLIYAAVPGHPVGTRVARRFEAGPIAGAGSTLLIPELLTKPIRERRELELRQLQFMLGRLDLHPVDEVVAQLAAILGARHRLKAADAVHLATAVRVGADRFVTNNRRDFRRESIDEVDVTYPEDL